MCERSRCAGRRVCAGAGTPAGRRRCACRLQRAPADLDRMSTNTAADTQVVRAFSRNRPRCIAGFAQVPLQARSLELNKEETTLTFPLPFLPSSSLSLPSFPFTSRTPPLIAARGSAGALKHPQRVRAEPGRQTHLAAGLSKMLKAPKSQIWGSR